MPQKKPTSLKVIAGTIRPDRDTSKSINLPLVQSVPLAPDWLPNAHAIKEFEKLAQILTANGLLTEAGISALAVLCSLHGKIVQLFAAGETPLGNMVAQYRSLVNDFGLTPIAQGKVKPVGESPKGNKFSNNGKRGE